MDTKEKLISCLNQAYGATKKGDYKKNNILQNEILSITKIIKENGESQIFQELLMLDDPNIQVYAGKQLLDIDKDDEIAKSVLEKISISDIPHCSLAARIILTGRP